MQYVQLGISFVLCLLLLTVTYALIVTWRRLRRLEMHVSEWNEHHSQGGFLLHEFLAELEQAGNSLLALIEERERQWLHVAQSIGVDMEHVELLSAEQLQVPAAEKHEGPHDSRAMEEMAVTPEVPSRADIVHLPSKDQARHKIAEVERLAAKGHTAETIARELKIGMGEVQLILELTRLDRRR